MRSDQSKNSLGNAPDLVPLIPCGDQDNTGMRPLLADGSLGQMAEVFDIARDDASPGGRCELELGCVRGLRIPGFLGGRDIHLLSTQGVR